ncbi:FAD-dependent oxidoreductase [Chloroflexota bacterium]
MDKKLAVYVCSGCGIGDCLDTDKISDVATKEFKIEICKINPFLCGEEGANLIKKDIEEGVNTVVIAACSLRVNQDVFSYESSIVLERINLREHVSWSHPANDEDTQMLAEDYLRMGIAKAQKVTPPEPYQTEMDKTILVVGGGITGMTAAIEAASTGYEVCIVEKNPTLGGWISKLHKQFPKHSPHREMEDTGIEAKIKEIEDNPKIKVYTGTEIEKIQGAPGMFDVFLNGGTTFKAGSIIEATGFKPYDANKLEYLGYGKYPDVITNVQMEEMAKNGGIKRPSDGKDAENVVFIQCAGSRDENHLPYCSSFCCLTSLKQALYVREQNSNSNVYILYKDMRTPAQYEDFYRRVQEEETVFFTKGEVQGISEDGGSLIVDVDNTLLGEKIGVKADLVVLATGMVPTSMPEIQWEVIAEVEATAEETEEAVEEAKTADTGDEDEIDESAPDSGFYAAPNLHLDYRQGPELPTLKYGFPDSHFICFPYETRRTGIYAAGTVRQPGDIVASMEDAGGAALKAIQCIELTSKGEALHPRVGDMTYPDLFMQRCTQCKRCTMECPFGMYEEDDKFNPLPNPTRCRRCAICMGSCPERIISFNNYSVDIVGSMIKAIEVPDEFEEKPRVVAFFCENDAYPALDMAGIHRLTYNPYVRIIPVRCLGSMNIVWIADALSKGIDGIMLIGCKYGDDNQCHFIKGSELANYRMEKVQETLKRLVLESERIKVLQLSISDYDTLPKILDDFVEEIDKFGPNPYKNF